MYLRRSRSDPTLNQETFEKTAVAYVETLVERDALEELLKHPLLADLPRAEGYPVLGSYVLFAQLGSGGMANVFRGVHVRLENEVAIKIRTAPVGTAAARFQREATVAAKLEHQNLLRATDVDEIAGLQYMVLDYIDGEDADERVARKGALDAREALTIIRDSALGLAEAHRLDFIHRDIKPANVMISSEGRVKLADLGLAKSVVDDDLGLTATGGILGTPMYMAPEQFRRAEEVVKASDVYGLGVSLVFLLTARHPFDGKSVPEIMQQVCVQGVAGLAQTLPGVDPRVAELVAEITALKVEDRPQDGAALAARMTTVLDALGGPVDLSDVHAGASKARGVNPPGPAARTRIKEALTRPSTAPASDTAVGPVREPKSGLKWVAAAMLLAAGGGIGWTVLDRQEGGAKGAIDRILGGESKPSQPAKSSDLVMNAPDQAEAPIIFDVASVRYAAQEHVANENWDDGYTELLAAAKEAVELEQLDALVGPVEEFSKKFESAHLFKSALGLLSESGKEDLRELADLLGMKAPLTSMMAAEIGVAYNGLLYETEGELGSTRRFLSRAAQGEDEEIRAEAKFLQGVLQVYDYFSEQVEHKGMDAQARLTEAAEDRPKGEAAAWLGLLYLNFRDQGISESNVPPWFDRENMLKLLGSAAGETLSGEADSVMGHLCSEGLAGVPRSIEEAKVHYVTGAKRGHIGCIGDAVYCGADLTGMLVLDWEKKLLYFADHGSGPVQAIARESYALAALTSSFRDESEDRRARAIQFLQSNADVELAGALETDRQIDRVITCLGAMLQESQQDKSRADEYVAWVKARSDSWTGRTFGDEISKWTVPVWLLLAEFDAELAKEVVVRVQGKEFAKYDLKVLVAGLAGNVDPSDYANRPFVWSFVEPVVLALQDR